LYAEFISDLQKEFKDYGYGWDKHKEASCDWILGAAFGSGTMPIMARLNVISPSTLLASITGCGLHSTLGYLSPAAYERKMAATPPIGVSEIA
jgi:hypothetical protein